MIPEGLVDLREMDSRIKVRVAVRQTSLVRRGVAMKLKNACRYLPSGYGFLVTNAWRSRDVQEWYRKRYKLFFRRSNPGWSMRRVDQEVNRYVHPSSGVRASGHLTGGAIDVFLCSLESGRRMPMESGRLSFEENAKSFQRKLPKAIERNRAVMFAALKKEGFVNYPQEYWHWCYGERLWALTRKRKAIYGIISR